MSNRNKAVTRKTRPTDSPGVTSSPTGEFIWGINPILEVLNFQSGRIRELQICKKNLSGKLKIIVNRAEELGIPVIHTKTFQSISGSDTMHHQGVIAKIFPHETMTLNALLKKIESHASPTLLALDSILDPHNLGAIIRTASAASIAGIILPKDRTAPLSGTTAKVSAGALAHIDICRVTNLAEALKQLKEHGFWIFGAQKTAATSIYQTEFSGPTCLVIGGEEKGIRPLVQKQCDHAITIPMTGRIDSLNASVAAAIILFEVFRQKHIQNDPQ
ncbi:23S rRNA (guanosine(2251)-2'-O)-methyltransferase RlmB [Thermodesulfobacteriota bacterium]